MQIHLVAESIKFMILGMGIVFVFLYILVLLMQIQAWMIERYFCESKEPPKPTLAQESEEEERARVAAIVAAILEHRKSAIKG